MQHASEAAYSGARELIEQLPDDTHVTVTLFSSTVELGRRTTRAEALRTLSLRDANGTTCLNDAICLAVDTELESPAERVTVVVVTDGQDTSSRRSVNDAQRAVARFQAVPNWRILFMGSNQDAVVAAGAFGIPVGRAITYGTDPTNLRTAMRVASENTRAFRTTGADAFLPAQRAASVL